MAGNTYPFGWVGPLYGLDIGNATSIQGAAVDPAPTNDDILQYNAGNNTWENKNIGEVLEITGSDNQVMRYDTDTGFIQSSNLIITDTDNLTGVNTLQVNELDGPAAGITTATDIDAGANKVKSTAVPAANDELTNKLYVDGEVADKVDGPAVVVDTALAIYDGTTGKIIKGSSITIPAPAGNGMDFNNGDLINLRNLLVRDITPQDALPATGIDINGNLNVGTNFVNNSAVPTNNDHLTNKLYVDGEVADKVVGPASVADTRICVFDGTTGKLIKQENINISGTLLEGFDDIGNPSRIEIGNDLYMFENDIAAVADLGVDSITANTGSVITFNNKPQSSTAPSVNDDLTNKLYVDSVVGNLYCMIADGATVSDGDPETSLLASGVGDSVGTLTVPANGFAVGDAFHFVVAGDCVFDNSNEITLKLNNSGTLASITMELEDTTGTTSWELEADFVIRSIGSSASIITNFDFTFNKKALKDFKGVRNVVVSSIDTTVSNTLDITAEFTVAPQTSSITAKLAYLKRMH
jgi:hypothetical protein